MLGKPPVAGVLYYYDNQRDTVVLEKEHIVKGYVKVGCGGFLPIYYSYSWFHILYSLKHKERYIFEGK